MKQRNLAWLAGYGIAATQANSARINAQGEIEVARGIEPRGQDSQPDPRNAAQSANDAQSSDDAQSANQAHSTSRRHPAAGRMSGGPR